MSKILNLNKIILFIGILGAGSGVLGVIFTALLGHRLPCLVGIIIWAIAIIIIFGKTLGKLTGE